MKRKSILFLAVMFCAVVGVNAQGIRSAFIEMPDTLMMLLTQNDRRDCIDFVDAGMRAVVTNRLGGKSELTQLYDNYLSLKTSDSSTMQMRLLPCLDGDTVLCVVNTVRAEVPNSEIRFYNNRWEELRLFEKPRIKDFFIPSDTLQRYVDMADIYLVELRLFPQTDSLRANYTMPGYMSKDDSVKIAPMLRTLWYDWDGKSYR